MSISGYYVPGKIANSVVANQQNDKGAYVYEDALRQNSMQTQAAIQSLNKTYSDTINNAYNSYLNSKYGVMGSRMGQGYKEMYQQAIENDLQANIAQANLSSAEAKQELLQSQQEADAAVGSAFQTEVLNIEKAKDSLSNYFAYVNSLSNAEKGSYFTADEQQYSLDRMYEKLLQADPRYYKDIKGKQGLTWMQWAKSQATTAADQEWYDWLSANKNMVDKALIEKARDSEQQYQQELMKQYTPDYIDQLANANQVTFDKLNINENDWALFDFGEQGSDKLSNENAIQQFDAFRKSLGLSDTEVNIANDLKAITDASRSGYWKPADRSVPAFLEKYMTKYDKNTSSEDFAQFMIEAYQKYLVDMSKNKYKQINK